MNLIEYERMYEAEESHWWYVGLHELILEHVRRESRRLARPLAVFDAGSGTGRLCQLLKTEGHDVSGCDISEEALRLCRLRDVDNILLADLNEIELEPEAYDLITSIDVLYHQQIVDDVAVLRQLRRGLRPGGKLILNLVAHEFLRSTHDIAVHTRERYTRRTVYRRLQAAGFNIVRADYRVSFAFPFIAAYRIAARHLHLNRTGTGEVDSDVRMPAPLVNSLLRALLKLENSLHGTFSFPFGSSVYVVACKPAEDVRQ